MLHVVVEAGFNNENYSRTEIETIGLFLIEKFDSLK